MPFLHKNLQLFLLRLSIYTFLGSHCCFSLFTFDPLILAKTSGITCASQCHVVLIKVQLAHKTSLKLVCCQVS